MLFSLNVSHSLKSLFDTLQVHLQQEQSDPFTAQWLVTQTEGINNWIRYRYAERSGIAANLAFAKTNDLVGRIFHWIVPHEKPLLDRTTVTWTLYQLLEEDDFMIGFPDKAAYGKGQPVKQMAFAMQMADLFDQYQVYRHTHIGEWNKYIDRQEEVKDWQQYLWVRLKQKTRDRFIDRFELAEKLKLALLVPEHQDLIRQRIPQLHFFGMAIITPYYLDLFKTLSSFLPIHFYLLNPCPEHPWMDTQTEKQIAKMRIKGKQVIPEEYVLKGNDLLIHWGRILKESFYLLVQDELAVNAYTVVDTLPPCSTNASLLQKIQYDIYMNAAEEERLPLLKEDLSDGSVVINGCYTPVREVEVLYNFLLQQFANSKSGRMGARDVLVLVSDIDAYAPIIHAIFRHGPKELPYTIADESIVSGNTIFSALKEILSLSIYSLKSEEVLSLLESPFIRRKFGFIDATSVRQAVREASIFFGTTSVKPDSNLYQQSEVWMLSWEYGLKKMIYGLCMSGSTEYFDGTDWLYPLDTAEGAAMEERLRLLHFYQVLRKWLNDRREDRTLTEWATYLLELMHEMIVEPGEEEDQEYAYFIRLIEEWKTQDTEEQEKISYDVFRYAFFHRLDQEKRQKIFAGAGITFCSLVPMRSVPHKVVAMLGINFDSFPRKDQTLSFNMMHGEENKQIGDRDIRENDHHLFLETLLSAEQTLYISYIARSQKDGSLLPASSIVDHLIDYVARGVNVDSDSLRKEWITVHPLHHFSYQYDGIHKISYLHDQQFVSAVSLEEKIPEENTFDFTQIPLANLASFMENPPKWYLNKALGIYYNDEEALIPEHELFTVDTLKGWAIKHALYKEMLYGETLPDEDQFKQLLKRLKQSGMIPLANVGKEVFLEYQEMVSPYVEAFRSFTNGNLPDKIEIHLPIGSSTLVGQIDMIFGENLIYFTDSSSIFKNLIRAWVYYLAALQKKSTLSFCFICKLNKQMQLLQLPAGTITDTEAKQILTNMMEHYRLGHFEWFRFFPELGRNGLKAVSGDYVSFVAWYNKIIDNKKEFRLKDQYLLKAAENGFYDASHYEELKNNVQMYMQPLANYFPSLFK
jgi:exodeoxyribonuclease V gamma subunit